jgi:hypothetical protein
MRILNRLSKIFCHVCEQSENAIRPATPFSADDGIDFH